jgi:hypothetical protein
VLPYPFPLANSEPSRRILAGKHPAPPRDYIAIGKFFLGSFLLDPGTCLRELELTFIFKRLSIVNQYKIIEKSKKYKLKFVVTLLMNPVTFA